MRVLQLGHRSEVAGFQLRHVRLRLALEHEQVAQALRRVVRGIPHRGVGLQRSGNHPQHGDPAGERIGDRLPDEGGVRGGIRRRDFRVGALGILRVERALRGGRHVCDDGVEQRLNAHDLRARRADEREELRGEHRVAQAGLELLLRERPFGKEDLKQGLVSLSDGLDQVFPRGPRPGRQLRWDLPFRHTAGTVRGKGQRRHPHEVDDAGERLCFADR